MFDDLRLRCINFGVPDYEGNPSIHLVTSRVVLSLFAHDKGSKLSLKVKLNGDTKPWKAHQFLAEIHTLQLMIEDFILFTSI